MKRILIFISVVLLFTGCQTYPDAKGKLIVSNDSFSDFDSIKYIYARHADMETGWTLVWSDDKGRVKNESASFFLDAGSYDVKITVRNFFTYNEYITGYKHPVEIERSAVSIVTFDGKGIYSK